MSMGRRQPQQAELFVAAAELPRSPGHAFYDRLNRLLDEAGFDRHAEGICQLSTLMSNWLIRTFGESDRFGDMPDSGFGGGDTNEGVTRISGMKVRMRPGGIEFRLPVVSIGVPHPPTQQLESRTPIHLTLYGFHAVNRLPPSRRPVPRRLHYP